MANIVDLEQAICSTNDMAQRLGEEEAFELLNIAEALLAAAKRHDPGGQLESLITEAGLLVVQAAGMIA